jgi:hypothetical protein
VFLWIQMEDRLHWNEKLGFSLNVMFDNKFRLTRAKTVFTCSSVLPQIVGLWFRKCGTKLLFLTDRFLISGDCQLWLIPPRTSRAALNPSCGTRRGKTERQSSLGRRARESGTTRESLHSFLIIGFLARTFLQSNVFVMRDFRTTGAPFPFTSALPGIPHSKWRFSRQVWKQLAEWRHCRGSKSLLQ